jgi:hypothetical protein
MYASDASAYIDPSTGGYIFQILFPVISAIAGALMFFNKRLKSLFSYIRSLFPGGNTPDKHE